MMRQLKLSAFLVAVTAALSGAVLAQVDDDDYYERGDGVQARQYGYQNGYRDGYNKGRHEGRENDPNDYQTPDWRQASRGYQGWMGPIWVFQNAYRNGYQNGFRAGYLSVNRDWGDGNGDADDYPAVYSGGYGGSWFGNRAYQIGFRDGASVAREDAARGKPFNPNPRGRYDDEDHGYSSAYGNKSTYKAQYANGYRAGYESARDRY